MKQGFLFSDDVQAVPSHDDGQGLLFRDDDAPTDSCDCAACQGSKLEVVCERTGAHPDCPLGEARGAFNHCTLEGRPARVIGRSFHYATIEPVDLDAEPIRCCWDVVAHVLDECGGAFVRTDDDTHE